MIWKNNRVSQRLNETQNVSDEYGETRGLIFTFITTNPEPENVEPIKKFETNTIAPWAFLVFLIIFGVPIRNTIYRSHPEAYSNAFGDVNLSETGISVGLSLRLQLTLLQK
jgi:hypothetical protein